MCYHLQWRRRDRFDRGLVGGGGLQEGGQLQYRTHVTLIEYTAEMAWLGGILIKWLYFNLQKNRTLNCKVSQTTEYIFTFPRQKESKRIN